MSAANNQLSSVDLSKNILLEKLFIANNQLTSLNLSNNINLINIDVGENQLNEIDVHLLIGLETLSIYKNQLTEINLFSNKELLAFLASDNQLKTVDFRVNKELNWVDLKNNGLENLNLKNGNNTLISDSFFDLTGNPSLTCVEVDDVNYSETNWTKIDSTASFAEECAPTNNQCSNAIPLFSGQQIPRDINGGTFNNNLTDCVVGNVIADVWYKIIVPNNGEFSIQGASADGLLKFALYDNCTNTSSFACGETISLTNQIPGTTYYLRVWLETITSGKTALASTTFGNFTLQINESSVLSKDANELCKSDIQLFPNPASNFIKISNDKTINSIEIFSSLGKRILKITLKELNNKSIDVSKLASGIYLLKINNKQFKKIIIN